MSFGDNHTDLGYLDHLCYKGSLPPGVSRGDTVTYIGRDSKDRPNPGSLLTVKDLTLKGKIRVENEEGKTFRVRRIDIK